MKFCSECANPVVLTPPTVAQQGKTCVIGLADIAKLIGLILTAVLAIACKYAEVGCQLLFKVNRKTRIRLEASNQRRIRRGSALKTQPRGISIASHVASVHKAGYFQFAGVAQPYMPVFDFANDAVTVKVESRHFPVGNLR